ncbi:MAG: radical SAM protein [bacterium]|nr:radical SAM protein [bacterium]
MIKQDAEVELAAPIATDTARSSRRSTLEVERPADEDTRPSLPFADDQPKPSGILSCPIDAIRRPAVTAETAKTELEKYKVSLRKYAPVQKGRQGLPWACQSHCIKCDQTVASQYVYDRDLDEIYLEYDCPTCGAWRERHEDVLFVKNKPGYTEHQPKKTYKGFIIRPVVKHLPKTVETLCPECACNILGRYYVKDGAVYIEKTCPEHGYYRDKISSDAELYIKSTRSTFEDQRGVHDPQVDQAHSCPSDCGLCNQHITTSCLAQIDLTNRCNLTCPVCFACANTAGYVSEPSYEMVVEMLQSLRNQHPYPATAIQFTGGEPTIHPEFHRIVRKANQMGFSHVQIATNGITHANLEFAKRSAEAGLHTMYLQFDGLDDGIYKKVRAEELLEKKLACIENCHQVGLKICLVPTIINNFNDDQVAKIFRFAVDNINVISAISYQPVVFTGRIAKRDLEAKRYTLGHLAHDIAGVSGADPQRDFFPLSFLTPMSKVMQLLDGKPKIRPGCHSDCAFGTYFFVTPERDAIPMPKLFDVARLFGGFNELYHRIAAQRNLANHGDKLRIAWEFIRSYRWRYYDRRVSPFTFIRALRGLTDKDMGRGEGERNSYKTLMAAGMHFMDRYNYDVERVRRCVIQYSTPDGIYPFCTVNSGPTYRPFIEHMYAHANPRWQAENPDIALRPSSHPNAVMPWANRQGFQEDESERWNGGGLSDKRLLPILEAGRLNGNGNGGCGSGCGCH